MEGQPELSPCASSSVLVDSPEPIYTPTLNCHDYIFSGEPPKTTEELLWSSSSENWGAGGSTGEANNICTTKNETQSSSVKFYTGFPSFDVLVATFRALSPTAQNMYSWSQMQRLRNKGIRDVEGLRQTMRGCKLSLFDQFYLVLQKLRVGTLNQVLADNFNISQTTVSRVFISWINFLYFMLGSICIWPSRAKIQKYMPSCFKSLYPDCRGIIDASEIKVQAPSSLVLNSEMYSSYKSHTTYKG